MFDAPIYQGTKRLRAAPMTKAAYCAHRGWSVPADEDPDELGYLVEYLDGGPAQAGAPTMHQGYISWSPKSVFDGAYRPCDTHLDRMHIEHDQLTERLDKLEVFVGGAVFNLLPAMEQEVMRIQLSAMRNYWRALGLRLDMAGEPMPEQERPGKSQGPGVFVRDEPVMDTSAFK